MKKFYLDLTKFITSDRQMATKQSIEVTKGGSLVDVVPGEVRSLDSNSQDESSPLGPFPTQEEWDTLPRVPGKIPWTAWTVAFVEFVERFSYYGTSAVCS